MNRRIRVKLARTVSWYYLLYDLPASMVQYHLVELNGTPVVRVRLFGWLVGYYRTEWTQRLEA